MTAVEQRWAPFRRFNMPLPRRERVKLAFGLVLLAPVRLLGVCLIATGFAVYATLVAATLGVGPGAHRAISVPGAACARAILWLCGFYSIRIVELPSHAPHADEPPSVIVANHLSYIDVFVLMACFGFPSFLAKEAIRDVPVVGRVCTVCRGLYVARVRHAEPHYYGEVARQVPDADAAAAGPAGGLTAALTARRGEVAAGRAPPVALFPEGTTTNGSAVIRFHTGAFVGGRPCALAMLRYPHRHFNPSWETFFFVPHLLELLCQWRNDVEVRFIRKYTPSAAEAREPALYAQNVRALMARHLGLPLSDASYRDKLEYHEWVTKTNRIRRGLWAMVVDFWLRRDLRIWPEPTDAAR